MVLSTPQLFDPSMEYLYQYQQCYLTHRGQLGETRHIAHFTTDGSFLYPMGGPIHTPDSGTIDEGLISISAMKSHP